MPRDRLRQSLHELHDQLDAAGPIDSHAREQLRGVMEEIRQVLQRAEAREGRPTSTGEDHETGLMDRLHDSVEQFEGDHPTITTTVLEIIATLHRMGF